MILLRFHKEASPETRSSGRGLAGLRGGCSGGRGCGEEYGKLVYYMLHRSQLFCIGTLELKIVRHGVLIDNL